MLKKFFSLFTALLITCLLCVNAFAVENNEQSIIHYFEDGSYIVTTLSEESDGISLFATSTKTGRKTDTCYNANHEVLWSATLTGTFSYTGTSATCTNASVTYSIQDTSWRIVSAEAYESGATAIGDVTGKRYVLGINVDSFTAHLEITCSPTGVLS
ncbi:MAG: hypothetical protein IJA31_08400 [Clostridia bacterium]|nr:hypothetical protein [Clostridia bacterium]MBQ4630812.1 hypothetical protein [Clostridia bacterium]MBQ6863656.1 hypothetical protein [Clostridia bacterium]